MGGRHWRGGLGDQLYRVTQHGAAWLTSQLSSHSVLTATCTVLPPLQNLALNVAEKGFNISVYNRSGAAHSMAVGAAAVGGRAGQLPRANAGTGRSPCLTLATACAGDKTDAAVARAQKEGVGAHLRGYHDLKDFVASLERPRCVPLCAWRWQAVWLPALGHGTRGAAALPPLHAWAQEPHCCGWPAGGHCPDVSVTEGMAPPPLRSRIIILVKAGKPVDSTIEQLTQYLEPGDIIIDGGNEWCDRWVARARRPDGRLTGSALHRPDQRPALAACLPGSCRVWARASRAGAPRSPGLAHPRANRRLPARHLLAGMRTPSGGRRRSLRRASSTSAWASAVARRARATVRIRAGGTRKATC